MNSGDFMMGDEVPRSTHDKLPVTLQVRDAAGMMLQLVGAEGVMLQKQMMIIDERVQAILDISGSDYVYARLLSASSEELLIHCITNPLYCPYIKYSC